MEYFLISAKFVPLKYYTLSSQLQRLASFSVGCSGRRILSPGQINIMRKWRILRRFNLSVGKSFNNKNLWRIRAWFLIMTYQRHNNKN